jgi:hypothetical protein
VWICDPNLGKYSLGECIIRRLLRDKLLTVLEEIDRFGSTCDLHSEHIICFIMTSGRARKSANRILLQVHAVVEISIIIGIGGHSD